MWNQFRQNSMSTQPNNLDRVKMKHVILYFLERINNFHLGRTKLMKLLYYVDFDHCEKYGTSVTCAKYRKLPHGPVPDEAETVIDEMAQQKDVEPVQAVVTDSKGKVKYKQSRLLALNAKFDPSMFSGTEMETIERVATCWVDSTAKQMEDASHKEAPWAATDDGKAIDYEMAHYRTPISDGEDVDKLLSETPSFSRFVSSLA